MSTEDLACHPANRNAALLHWASRINSELNEQQLELLDSIQVMNSFSKAIGPGEKLIPVGSCVDGSKVNIPRDNGDIDVLIVSGNTILSEHLFEYIDGFPAFLTIPLKDEHLNLFRNVKPVGGRYLPARILQDMEKELFNVVKMIITSNLMPKSVGDNMRIVRRSKVGYERHEVTGIRSEMDDILKLPREEPETGENIFNGLTYLNEGVDVIQGELMRLNNPKKHERVTQEAQFPVNKAAVKSYEGVGDIIRIAGDIIGKFQTLNDSDSEDSENDENTDVISDNKATITNTIVGEENNVKQPKEVKKKSKSSCDDITDVGDQKCIHNTYENNSKVSNESKKKEMDKDGSIDVTNTLIDQSDAEYGTSNATTKEANDTDRYAHTTHMNTEKPKGSKKSYVSSPEEVEEATNIDYENIESADFVPAFGFSGWPKPAEEWVHRARKWPTEEIKQEVLHTSCQVIVKPLPTDVNSDETYIPAAEDKMFRLSFASQELILARSLKDTQMLCWKILKALQMSVLETKPRVMTSYLWKNAIFWVCEKTEASLWKEENTLECLISCLDFALQCLKNRFFPQYFVREMNLILHCSVSDVERTLFTIEMLKKDPILYLKQFIENPPKPSSLKLTQNDIEKIVKSKEKNQEFCVMKTELLNAFRCRMERMSDEDFDSGGMRMKGGLLDMVEQMEIIHGKREGDQCDTKEHGFMKSFFNSFKELLQKVEDDDDSNDDSVIPAPFQKMLSSMVNIFAEGMSEHNGNSSERSKHRDKVPEKRRKLEDFDLD